MDKILSVAAIGVGNRTRKYLTYITDHPEAVRLDSVVETNPERLACAKLNTSISLTRRFIFGNFAMLSLTTRMRRKYM